MAFTKMASARNGETLLDESDLSEEGSKRGDDAVEMHHLMRMFMELVGRYKLNSTTFIMS